MKQLWARIRMGKMGSYEDSLWRHLWASITERLWKK